MRFSFPPMARRIVAQRSAKSNVVSLIEQVCILPVGGGLWFPIRNLTRTLSKLEGSLSAAEKQLDRIKNSLEEETAYINKEIERIGFYTDAALVKDPTTGEFKIVDFRTLVDFRLGNKRKVTASSKPKTRKEVYSNLLIETRKPKDNSGKDKGNNKGNGNN